jgi:hypothetical protein
MEFRKLLFYSILLLSFGACSKWELPESPNCKVLSTENGLSKTVYIYDAQGRLLKQTNSFGNPQKILSDFTYTYSGSQVVEISATSTLKTLYFLNAKELASSREILNLSSQVTNRVLYEYDNLGFLKKRTTNSIDASSTQITNQTVENFTYQNGNLTLIQYEDGAKVSYSYYNDKFLLYDFGRAYLGSKNKNLIQKIDYVSSSKTKFPNSKIEYEYEYNNGQVTKSTLTFRDSQTDEISTSTTSNYQYSCL